MYKRQRLERQKAEGIYKKEYLALASGCPEKKSGEIRQPVRRIPGELMKMEVSPFGKDAWTEYEILEEYRIEKEHMRLSLIHIYTRRRRRMVTQGRSFHGNRHEMCIRDRYYKYADHNNAEHS